ncbi:hypothetical protein D9M70_593880 [compost metagenome]
MSRAPSPSLTRLVITDTGIDSSSEPTMGDSHQRNSGSSQATSAAQATPSSVCGPWRRTASLHGVASSSRCGDFHTASQPRNAASTKRVWKSMRTGASSTEKSISRSMLRVTLITPP